MFIGLLIVNCLNGFLEQEKPARFLKPCGFVLKLNRKESVVLVFFEAALNGVLKGQYWRISEIAAPPPENRVLFGKLLKNSSF